MAVYVKMISSWVRKFLSIAKVHMFLGTFKGAAKSSPLVAGVSWCPPCRQVTGPEIVCQLDTIFQYKAILQIGTRTICSVLRRATA